METPETATEATSPERIRPDELTWARLGRLVLLLTEIPKAPGRKPIDVDRIGTYDFFTDSPFLLFDEDTKEHRLLLLAGFDPVTYSYSSSSQRFANRRSRIQSDLAQLVARELIEPQLDGSRVTYRLTERGSGLAEEFKASYAESYRQSAALVARALNRLSDRGLREKITAVLASPPFVIDLYRDDENVEALK